MWSDRKEEYIKGILWASQTNRRVHQLGPNLFLLDGGHAPHQVQRIHDLWICDCAAFQRSRHLDPVPFCHHIIAVERWLETIASNIGGIHDG